MRKYAWLLTTITLAACGCASPVPPPRVPLPPRPELSRVHFVQTGMKPAEVRNLLGEPSLIESHEDDSARKTWHFDGGVVIFESGRVSFRHALPKNRARRPNPPALGTRPVMP